VRKIPSGLVGVGEMFEATDLETGKEGTSVAD
jgi:hypothetical protein